MKKSTLIFILSLILMFGVSSSIFANPYVHWYYWWFSDGYTGKTYTSSVTASLFEINQNTGRNYTMDHLVAWVDQEDWFCSGIWTYEWSFHYNGGINQGTPDAVHNFGVKWFGGNAPGTAPIYSTSSLWGAGRWSNKFNNVWVWADDNNTAPLYKGYSTWFMAKSIYAPTDVQAEVSWRSGTGNWEDAVMKWQASGPVPEPGTLLLLGCGLLGLGTIARYRRKKDN